MVGKLGNADLAWLLGLDCRQCDKGKNLISHPAIKASATVYLGFEQAGGFLTNLLGRLPEVEQKLRSHIDGILPTFERSREATLERLQGGGTEVGDPMVEERLRDLGYIE